MLIARWETAVSCCLSCRCGKVLLWIEGRSTKAFVVDVSLFVTLGGVTRSVTVLIVVVVVVVMVAVTVVVVVVVPHLFVS